MQSLIAFPRDGFTEPEVRNAVDLNLFPRVRHGVDVLNTLDKKINVQLEVQSGSVSWDYRSPDEALGVSSVTDVRRQANMQVRGYPPPQLAAYRYRPWTEWATADSRWIRFYMGIFVAPTPRVMDDGKLVNFTLDLADKSFRYSQRFLNDSITVAAGTNPIEWIRTDLLATFLEGNVNLQATTLTLVDAMVFEAGTSYLEVYNALLKLAGYDDLITDENGIPSSYPLATQAARGSEFTYKPGEGRMMIAGSTEPLLPSLPNVVQFTGRSGPSLPVEGNGIRTIRNQSTGPASIDSRNGEEIWLRVDVEAENQTALDGIAAGDAPKYFGGGGVSFTGSVVLNPRHSDRDVVTLIKPRLHLSGEWNVTAWSYPLNRIKSASDITMSITAEQRVVVS